MQSEPVAVGQLEEPSSSRYPAASKRAIDIRNTIVITKRRDIILPGMRAVASVQIKIDFMMAGKIWSFSQARHLASEPPPPRPLL